MSAAYDAAQWTDLFVATAGAAAALAGLLFVAISINVERILSFKGLPERALEALLVLVGALVVAVLCLAPVRPTRWGGSCSWRASSCSAPSPGWSGSPCPSRHDRSAKAAIGQVMLALIATAPYVVGAITLLAEAGGGLYWVLAGVIGAIVSSAVNAWVLLIEILR